MSMAILKSPPLIRQRLSLGDDRLPAQSAEITVDPRVAIEAELRAKLEAQYQTKLDAIKEEARAEGYKEGVAAGHQDGMASAVESFKKKQALLDQVLQKAEAQLEVWLQSVEEQAMNVAKDALGQFIGEQALNPTVLQNIIKRVSSNLRDADVLAIRLFPAECQALRAALKQGAPAGVQANSRILDKLHEDSSLEAGGVVIDTPRGEYRATLDVQLRKLMALLEEQRAASAATPAPVYHALRA